MKTQKGITLIALIITIIVMLILVGVSVSVALNTGLFKAAQGAAKNTEAERLNETKLSSGKVTIINATTGEQEEVEVSSFGTQGNKPQAINPQVGEYVSYSAGGVDTWRVIKNDGGKVVIAGIISNAMTYFNSYTSGEKTDEAMATPLKISGIAESAEFISPYEYTSCLTGIELESREFFQSTGLTRQDIQAAGLTIPDSGLTRDITFYHGWMDGGEALGTPGCEDGRIMTWWQLHDPDGELLYYYTDLGWGMDGRAIGSVTLSEGVTFSGEGTSTSPYIINQ